MSKEELVVKRTGCFRSLGRIREFLERISNQDSVNVTQLQVRLDSMNDIWAIFNETQGLLDIKLPSSKRDKADYDRQQDKVRSEFEEEFFEVKSSYINLIKVTSSEDNNQVSKKDIVQEGINLSSSPSLPKISLPHFQGNTDSWLPFYDLFLSLVHQNKNLSDIQRFYYLKGALRGEAADVIKNVTLSSDNYAVAWDLLYTTYHDIKVISQAHLKAIFSLPKVENSNSKSLRELLIQFSKNLKALTNLGFPTDSWDAISIYILTSKLDKFTLRSWEEHSADTDFPTLKQLEDFLQKRCKSLESYESKTGAQNTQYIAKHTKPPDRNKNNQCFISVNDNKLACPVCQSNHKIFNCDNFLNKSIQERRTLIQNLKLCWNCLSRGHRVNQCNGSKCKKCGERHNTLIHNPQPQLSDTSQRHASDSNHSGNSRELINEKSDKIQLQPYSFISRNLNTDKNKQTGFSLLPTAKIMVTDDNNEKFECRAILDTGSQLNFITQEFYSKLTAKRQKTSIPVNGLNNIKTQTSFLINVNISSRDERFTTRAEFHILPNITGNLPTTSIDVSSWSMDNSRNLADPGFNRPSQVDALLGSSLFFELLLGESDIIFTDHDCNYRMCNTRLGWIVGGRYSVSNFQGHKTSCQTNTTHYQFIDQDLGDYWPEIDALDVDMDLDTWFLASHSRNDDGRFILELPFKQDPAILGNSYNGALTRFLTLERRLNTQPDIKSRYIEFMTEYESLGHMSEIDPNRISLNQPNYYMPHHCIFKDSTTSNIRVVFDASFKTASGMSLNDIMINGPIIQPDLFSILLRFRLPVYALTADVCKMFRQILVKDTFTDFQRIIWRNSPSDNIKHYRLNTVTYGTRSAPYLAVRCLNQLALESNPEQSDISNIISNSFYMDDLITGGNSISELLHIYQETSSILKQGGFELRKWCSNSREFRNYLEGELHDEFFAVPFGDEDTVKTLGLTWKPSTDDLQFNVKFNSIQYHITKRSILSETAKIFDPLGFLSPITIKAKLFVQDLWSKQIFWDEPLSSDITDRWQTYRSELDNLCILKIPRRVLQDTYHYDTIQLHGFCDASLRAYGCCIYVVTNENGSIQSSLLCSKSRVASLKKVSLPRLELNGAVLLSTLMNTVRKTLNFQIRDDNVFYWSDSTIALAWIKGEPTRWKQYVSNRVIQIQRLSNKFQWRHVPSEQNPADMISRGISVEAILNCQPWWYGPSWLKLDQKHWPSHTLHYHDLPEAKNIRQVTLLGDTTNNCTWFSDISSWLRLVRVVSFVLRFISNSKVGNERVTGPLKVFELRAAKLTIMKLIQGETFAEEIRALQSGESVKKNSKLYNMSPFLDKDNLIRVGGRLTKAQIPYFRTFPIILPKHHVTKLIFKFHHLSTLHAGPQALLCSVRLEYWPLNGKNTAKQTVRDCITCRRCKPNLMTHLMGQLPAHRVQQSRPFQNTGIDFCGPITIKAGLRKFTKIKAYIAVFICLSTHAVHLELVSNLTSDAFLAALTRFISRRGKCSNIFTDNGTNFVGANRELGKMLAIYEEEFANKLSTQGIQWHFIPPNAPHFGGLWESAVKLVKHHMLRTIGGALLNFEETTTLLTRIEGILNSRPLTSLSSDPNDYSVLTPAHFLTGDSLEAIPEPQLHDTKQSRLSRWQLVQQLSQNLWRRWSTEYLQQLQLRTKWRKNSPNITPGTLVLVKEDNTPPLNWNIGRVQDIHPGKDGVVRVATIRMANGSTIKRPVVKLAPLMASESDNDN